MNRALPTVLIVLCLSACATSHTKDDSPASDLDALVSGMKSNMPARTLPNGKLYCVEDSETEGQRDDCALDLEDLAFVMHEDSNRAMAFLQEAVRKIKLRLNPCGKIRALFHPNECR